MRLVGFAFVLLAGPALAQAIELDPFWSEPPSAETMEMLAGLDPDSCPDIADEFEDYSLADNWVPRLVRPPERFVVTDERATQGERSLTVSLRQGDKAYKDVRFKHEVRVANEKRCRFGREIYYSFSFRIDGEYPRAGSTRWVIGQWKEESGASPFLAQRFDNGVFHITVQTNDERNVIAAAPGDYDAKYPFLTAEFREAESLAVKAFEQTGRRDTREAFLERVRAFGPRAFDVPRFQRAIVDQELAEFPFLADPQDYRRINGLEVLPSNDPILPNPQDGWVHMRYRVKGSREGRGLIEVWANGRFIVAVRGKIGSDVFDGPTQYFKIGHYRDVERDFRWSTIYVDDFKRSTDPSKVD